MYNNCSVSNYYWSCMLLPFPKLSFFFVDSFQIALMNHVWEEMLNSYYEKECQAIRTGMYQCM